MKEKKNYGRRSLGMERKMLDCFFIHLTIQIDRLPRCVFTFLKRKSIFNLCEETPNNLNNICAGIQRNNFILVQQQKTARRRQIRNSYNRHRHKKMMLSLAITHHRRYLSRLIRISNLEFVCYFSRPFHPLESSSVEQIKNLKSVF